MELCDNSLQKILDKRKKGFTSEQILNIMSQLNNTFKIMQKNKIIHRDIKLDNILIKYKDNKNNKNDSNINFVVKLADYGISKQLINPVNKTFIGAIETMAPEILEGKDNYDNKCDLWSIGVIIYQLFFKKYPYEGTQVAIYNQIKEYGDEIEILFNKATSLEYKYAIIEVKLSAHKLFYFINQLKKDYNIF